MNITLNAHYLAAFLHADADNPNVDPAESLALDLNLETCIRCTELSYNVAEGLGDSLRNELKALRLVARAAHAMARTLPVSRVWTREETELCLTSALLTNIIGDPTQEHPR